MNSPQGSSGEQQVHDISRAFIVHQERSAFIRDTKEVDMNTDMRIEQSDVIRDVYVMTTKVALTLAEGRHLILNIQDIDHIFVKEGTNIDEDEKNLHAFGVLHIVMKNSDKQSLFFTDNIQMVLKLVNSVNHWKFRNA